jgi:hypothetical protein
VLQARAPDVKEHDKMRVLLVSAWGGGRAFDELKRCASLDRFKVHTLTADPNEADLILFTENVHFDDPEWAKVLDHAHVRDHREKCFLYNEADTPWCVMQGLYCSMPKRAFQPRRQKAFNYLYTMNARLGEAAAERRWLYSFMGAANWDARRRILKLRDDRAVLEDTSTFNIWRGTADVPQRQERYADVLRQSLYVLCPRGAGTSSYRLFETMRTGIAPVLISDEWVPPDGPDWDAFMLRVPEAQVEQLPEIMRKHEREAVERGIRARLAYERYFSPEVQFHRAVEACRALLETRVVPEAVSRLVPSLEHQRSRVHRWLHHGAMFVRNRFGVDF